MTPLAVWLRPATTVVALFALPCAAQWTLVTSTNTPTIRRAGAMAFDPVGNRMLLYGGLDLSPTPIRADVHGFDGTTFTLLSPTNAPPARWGHAMTTDWTRQRIVAFGGRSPTFYVDANDTWEWDGSNWARVMTPTSPPPRHAHGLAFDEARGRMVLFGGLDLDGARGDTWEYDGTNWTPVVTAQSPPARDCAVFVHDAGRRVSVLHAGRDSGPPQFLFDDTWEYDGANWRQIVTLTMPPARYRAAGVFDRTRGRIVTYGGFGTAIVQQTWEFDGRDWTNTSGGGTAYATEMFAAWHRGNRQTFTFGGGGPLGVTNETWRYQGPATASWGPFGQGCSGSTTPVLEAASLPVLGATFSLEIRDVPAGTPVCLLAQGLSATTFGTFTLPLDLGPFGLTGCRLEIAVDVSDVVVVNGTVANLSYSIPNTPSLTGLPLFAQGVVPDVGAGNGIAAMTRAGLGVIGN
ncbi:MAG: hypothetical protein IPK26_20270 [Planctomycetes bacterium]|nr:hypothetical protein [Planctomycetota bacterium]